MAELGKRYRCEVCGLEALCTKAGDGKPVCCKTEMKLVNTKKLKSSD